MEDKWTKPIIFPESTIQTITTQTIPVKKKREIDFCKISVMPSDIEDEENEGNS